QVLHLLDEDAVEALVVAPGEDVRRVIGQAEDADALLLALEVLPAQGALADVLAEVAGVRPAAAIADDKDKAVALIAVVDRVGQRLHLDRVDAQELLANALQERANVQGHS